MMDPTLAEMGNHLSDAMKILESGKLESEQGKERRKLSWKDFPGPLQGDGQDVVSILQLVQNLMHGEDEKQGHRRMQYVGEQGHMALLGNSLAAYISVLEREGLRKLTTRILSDTTLWLCRLFRYENGSAYYHEDDCEGLVKMCRLAINTHYEDYATEGFTVLSSKPPVIYQSAASRPGLGQHLCSQLGLPLSSLCIVPCNTMFGSLHQMDVALLDKLIRDDRESGKLPLLLIANAGTPGAGHTDKLSRLKELCVQHNMWLHVEGVNLATLVLGQVSSTVTAATKCDSMTLTPGPWLGLPAVPAVTLYRHEDPALSLAAGLTSSQPVEKLRALPLWLSLQYLGHDGILQRIKHASQLTQQLLEHLKTLASIKTSDVLDSEVSLIEALRMVEDELNSPVVVFRFSQDGSTPSSGGSVKGNVAEERDILDALNRWLGEQLAQQVPLSGVDVVELEDEGTCVRFSPLMTAAALGTQENDVAALVEKLGEMIPVLSCTLRFRQDFKDEVLQQASLSYIEDQSWPGLGVVRYEARSTDLDEDKRQYRVEKINSDLLKKLMELDTDLYFSDGPEFCEEKNCIFIGMATEDLDVAELVETIVSIGKDIEESGKFFENMTEVVRRGIQEAEQQLQKANEEKLMEEGVLRQIPLVGSVLNWFSPVQASVKGRTFNLAEGCLDSTEPVYSVKAQINKEASLDSPKSVTKQFPGQKLFRRHGAGSDSVSDTSSVSHLEESFRETAHVQAIDAEEAEVPQEHHVHIETETALSDQRVPEGQETESVDALR
ncbi:pyridoxal-dependent decarboxylase domain-containing protein 1 isoform X1 [Carassius gibelio]|uniref:pyridoxal-dependent decarboxylase domain-containing protein 1 isoform X1 n=1 Tax=Carassius gibelio TaxID=101364 RepID=UPI0022784F52|nr:pyridoxal-dependent decarboxylase domain-containing protein 1 isoform X1 [Carassius gibelio]XP_052408953.1 pyridoxal-dependent decarboxylase domain-containing protein 1 isoform X1 [Carassius gibelio]